MHKVIWLLWYSGLSSAPQLVQDVAQSWFTQNPGSPGPGGMCVW